MAKTIGQLTQATTINPSDELVIEQSGQTKRVAASVVRGGLINSDIDAAAAIALSKLATGALPTAITVASANLVDGTIVNADINASAAIAGSKLADASVAPAKLSQPYTLGTAKASTSGTSIDFSPADGTGIPSWAKRITVMFSGVSTNGTSIPQIQIGAASFATSGYLGSCSGMTNVVASAQNSSGFLLTNNSSAAHIVHGAVTLTNITSNTWVAFGVTSQSDAAYSRLTSGSIALSGTLDRIRITTVNGTDTFDAGTINISYEG